MKLIIVHYHLRPGGIRRIIELATPHLMRALGGSEPSSVILATGEASGPTWIAHFRRQLDGIPVTVFQDASFNYVSEQSATPTVLTRRVQSALGRLLEGEDGSHCLVWAHNLGIARNLILTRELAHACRERGIPLVAHHHDWWFDNRWLRWPEMRRFGVRTLRQSAAAIFPAGAAIHHLAINQTDAKILRRHFSRQAGWLPNLTERLPAPPPARLRAARRWLRERIGDARAPVWLMPCRFLRRKNIGEALLLTRWLRPEAWLVTTGGPSSADEQPSFRKLADAARRHDWPLQLGLLQGEEGRHPRVAELIAASEAVLLTSIQEGFGLPYLEAAAAQRPLLARRLPNVAPDLRKFGFQFPYDYEEILVDSELFDWTAEQSRQRRMFADWKRRLPRACLKWVGIPSVLAAANSPRPVPFSRLTLDAQLEVLSQPVARSWERCAPLNPFLTRWREQAREARLDVSAWPEQASTWLSGSAYAQRFKRLVLPKASKDGAPPDPAAGPAAQEAFIAKNLAADHLFPLLWSRQA